MPTAAAKITWVCFWTSLPIVFVLLKIHFHYCYSGRFCLGTYWLANLYKIHNVRLHCELPVKNKTQKSVINFNILVSCLQHAFHGMAEVCKWPLVIHANICIELFIQSSLQFACVCDLLMSLAI
jgi:hypothetical protein